jgi:L-ascorbate metabolism protein UlaG (beta-lactamase superfamily)
MEIEYKGANCVVVKSKKGLIVTDPTSNVNASEAANKDAITLATQDDFVPEKANFVVNMPGEYEHNDISVAGISMRRHIDPEGKAATSYRIELDGVRVAVLGHIAAPISDDDLESLGIIDIVVVPVGGNGYTLDARDAAAVVRQISPKVVIPTHYAEDKIAYEVSQESVSLFIKEMGGAYANIDTLKIKNGSLPEAMTVYELKRK